jgi:hypothetical protein
MIKELQDLPDGVIGFEISGKVEADDYRNVVFPLVDRAAEAGDVRCVIVMPEFHGMSGGAAWQDVKGGLGRWGKWKRIALVTDLEWARHMTALFGWMTPGEVKTFALSEREQAVAWAAGSSD